MSNRLLYAKRILTGRFPPESRENRITANGIPPPLRKTIQGLTAEILQYFHGWILFTSQFKIFMKYGYK